MELIVELVKILWQKSDPMLIVCILILGYWQRQTSKKLDAHLDADANSNPYPHPQCKAHEDCYEELKAQLTEQHAETREDIQGLTARIDRALQGRCE